MIPSEVRMCFGGGCAPLFLLFFFREQKKMNARAKKMNKKRRDFLMHEKKGGQSRHTRIYSHHRSTGVTHTHAVFLAPAQNKERAKKREREAERREALFFYRR